MTNEVKIYSLKDPQQYADEKAFWDAQTPEYKLSVLESLRESWGKINNKNETDDNFKGLRRVFRIIKQK
jgi:hypothetical protein